MPHYAIIDTETSGLFDFSKSADADGQPRLASLHMILLDEDLAELWVMDAMVQPDGWVMSEEAGKINGLTTERLLAEGDPILDILTRYAAVIDSGAIIVAFNAQFDTKVMRGELRRADLPDRFETTPNICVMRPLADICQIPRASGRGFKFPKLAEACAHFKIVNDGAHTSGGDARAALEIFRKLRALGACPDPAVHYAKNRPDPVTV